VNRFFTLVLLAFIVNQTTAQNINLAATAAKTTEIPEDKETGIVKGIIQTTDNQPAAYVTVSLKDANRTTFTDESGNYTLKNIKPGQYILKLSMAGLQTKEEAIVIKANETTIANFTLPENRKELEEIVVVQHKTLNDKPVSVGKIALDPMDVPQALSVIGQGVIREQQALKLSDVIRNVNGVYLTTTRGNVQESFGARGYSLGSTNLFKNGFRINSGVVPEMSSLDRVEVLKGSAAILYGQVAPGGVVNMVTKQPKFNFGGEASMGVGSYDMYKPAIDVYGPISKSIAYRVNGTYVKANSFRDQVSSERYYVNPSLLFKLGKRTEVVAEGDYLNDNFTPDFGIGTLDGKKIPNVKRSSFFGTPWQYNKTRQTTTTLTIKHQLSDNWNLNASFSYQDYKRDYFAVERIQADSTGKWGRPLGRINTNEKFYAGQVNLIGKFTTATLEHNLLAGMDADRTVTTDYNYTFPAMNGFVSGIYDTINILDQLKYTARTDVPLVTTIRKRVAPVNRMGVYVQDLIKLSPKFNLLAGIRFAYVETRGIDSINLLNNNTKVTGAARYDHAFSPRFGLVYKPVSTTAVFVSYSNSFINNTGSDLDGKALKPSIIDQYELGVKNNFLNDRLSVNVTLYRIKNNNLAQTAPYLKDGTPNNNINYKIMSGQTTSDGVEVDLAASPLPGLNITAGYSYNYMRYTKTDTSVGSFKTGERLVNNPAHTANGSIFYNFSGRLDGFKIGTTIVYLGDRYAGWNTDVLKTGPVTYRDRLIAVSGYTTIDLSAGYTFKKKISLLARVSNLTNTYNVNVHENYSVNPIPPTQFTATVSYKF